MYIINPKTSRCSLCYALLFNNSTANSSTITYPSSISNRRYARRCSISSIERLISSSMKFERLWQKNGHHLITNRSICFRCCDTIRQIEQIQTDMEQLNNEKEILLNKIEHNLSKRALILQGQRQRTNPLTPNHQHISYDEDEDTEEGEEKPRTVLNTNGNGHATSSLVVPNTTLVGAKRRKCNLAHRINVDDKNGDSSSFNHSRRSSSPSISNKFSPSLLFGTSSSKHHRSNLFSSGLNGHDLFNSNYKSLALNNTPSTATPPFLDPTTGALIAIVSNPHHAALLAHQHQQILKSSSSISPSSTNTIDEHESLPVKPTTIPVKKFACQLCGRDFSNKSNLNRHHSIVHVALRNFECARCPKKFKLRQGLKTHMQRCHGVNTDEPTFVLQKHHLHSYHPSSSSLAQTNK